MGFTLFLINLNGILIQHRKWDETEGKNTQLFKPLDSSCFVYFSKTIIFIYSILIYIYIYIYIREPNIYLSIYLTSEYECVCVPLSVCVCERERERERERKRARKWDRDRESEWGKYISPNLRIVIIFYQYKFLQSHRKSTKVSPKRIIRTVLYIYIYIYIYVCVCVCVCVCVPLYVSVVKSDLETIACCLLCRLIAKKETEKKNLILQPQKIICLHSFPVNLMYTNFPVRKYTSTNRPRFRLVTLLHWTWSPSPLMIPWWRWWPLLVTRKK